MAELKDKQLRAISLLVTGQNIADTSAAVGVSRETVSRWVNHDPEFIAELNTQRQELWNGFEDRLRDLIPKALDVVSAEIEAGNVRTALTVLKMASFKPEPTGSTNAESITLDRLWS